MVSGDCGRVERELDDGPVSMGELLPWDGRPGDGSNTGTVRKPPTVNVTLSIYRTPPAYATVTGNMEETLHR